MIVFSRLPRSKIRYASGHVGLANYGRLPVLDDARVSFNQQPAASKP